MAIGNWIPWFCPIAAAIVSRVQLAAKAALVEKLAESAKKSLVVVLYTGRDGKQQGLGTGFVVKDVPEGHLCCGSAGTYNMLQPEIAGRLRGGCPCARAT